MKNCLKANVEVNRRPCSNDRDQFRRAKKIRNQFKQNT